jgi:hypothetical protein
MILDACEATYNDLRRERGIVLGELEAERLARVRDRVMDPQALQPSLHPIVERVVGRAHVGVLGIGGHGRDALRRECGSLLWSTSHS